MSCALLLPCVLQLIALVQRCKCEQQHEAVRSLAEGILRRWRWQLAGHMQVRGACCGVHGHVAMALLPSAAETTVDSRGAC